ncbi:MAG: hypothetical protein A2Y40_00975 [Candidatus Margulisbacteria bacterium GWF2_35_9]|nr:MAG: hypothetical protein A2Y40_00975 [Candidatus Margulisbacteria bacterium GWF2_35_9]
MLYKYLYKHIMEHRVNVICYDNEIITFYELAACAENLGKKLNQGKYGILCKSPINTAKSIMACLYANKTAVILSDKYGELHSGKIINSVGLSFIITDEEILKISVEEHETEDLNNVAFIMCTSGTTGKPKGAMITHDNLITNINDIIRYFKIESGSNILISRPLYHCAVLTGEFFVSLVRGLNIHFLNNAFNPSELIDIINKKSVNTMCGTPTLFYHLCRFSGRLNNKLPLSVAVCSGECMTETVAKEIRNCMPDTRIYNVYGLTEASPRVSYLTPELFDKHPTSVGVLLDAVTGRIENDELLIKGKSIMKGYYGDPEHTSEVIDKEGWFHTGDCAVIDKGLLYIKGRKDNLIIRSGMNIYPQEIENDIKKDKRIFEAYAFGVNDGKVGQKIHLWVESTSCTKKDILDLCLEQLPSYQIPDQIQIVEKIPKNASGKIIRRK